MSKDDIQGLMMGVAVVALGYALYTRFRPAQATSAAPGAATGYNFAAGETSTYTGIVDLFSGGILDTGAFNGTNYLAALESTQAPFLPGAFHF